MVATLLFALAPRTTSRYSGLPEGLLEAQIAFDRLLRDTPGWLAVALLFLAVLMVVLGRHGQRVLAGALLAFEIAVFALRILRPWIAAPSLRTMLAIAGGSAAMVCGLVWVGEATALCLGTALAAAGGLLAGRFGLSFAFGAVPFGLLGFSVGLAGHRRLSIALPPLGAAFALTLGLARLFGPHLAGAAVPQLAELPVAAAIFIASAASFLVLSVARARAEQRRKGSRPAAIEDEALKKQLERDRVRYAAAALDAGRRDED